MTEGIPFVDFRPHVAAYRAQIDAAIARVLDSGWFILGPECEAFERELAAYFGVADAVAVANGTEALQLALEALGVGAGDEVVTSPVTAAFSAIAVERAGATPVFADVDPDTVAVTPESVLKAITKRTKALMPVHLYGHPVDLEPMLDLAQRKGLPLLEDACQAHGALYKGRKVGSFGPLAGLSFYPTKNLGAFGDGGAILVGDSRYAERLRRLRNGGQSQRYYHDEPGINSRLDEMHCAVLRAKLPHLDAWTTRRREIAALYDRELQGSAVRPLGEQPYATSCYHLYVVRSPRRDALAKDLAARGVGTLIHYPVPLHLQKMYARLGGQPGDFPNAEQVVGEILSLPMYPELTDAQALQVAAAVRESR